MFIWIVVLGWLYVALMMALAEGMHPAGSWLGALFTFMLYGVGPVALVSYLLATPLRRQRRRHTQVAAAAPDGGAGSATASRAHAPVEPDARRHAAGNAIAPEREEF